MTIRSGSALLLCGLSAAFVGVERHHHAEPVAMSPPLPPRPSVVAASVAAPAVDSVPVDFAPVAAAPVNAVHTYSDAASGIRFGYPSTWVPEPAKTAVVAVAAPVGSACLSLDVPAMSWHPPFVPIGVVASRYVDALRKEQIPDAQVQQSTDVRVAGASARRVTARGHENGHVRVDDAIVLVHRGQIYILSVDSDDAGAPAAKAVLDAAVASVQWAK